MASTSIFAPQVRSVQPAFIYDNNNVNGKVKIYFSISSYNNWDNINEYMLISVIDPNQASTWGTNSMLTAEAAPAGILAIKFTKETDENGNNTENGYIQLDLNNTSLFNSFVLNQFYQVQIYFCEKSIGSEEGFEGWNSITSGWLSKYKNRISLPSQVTLIRPIAAAKSIVIEQLSGDLEIQLPQFKSISGYIDYEEDSSKIETIKSYTIEFYKDSDKVYSKTVEKNNLGLKFSTKIDYYFQPGEYKLIFNYTTLHDYKSNNIEKTFTIVNEIEDYIDWNGFELIDGRPPYVDENSGSVAFDFKIDFSHEEIKLPGTMFIQRTSELTNYEEWETVSTVELKTNSVAGVTTFNWHDSYVEGGISYKYRFKYLSNDNTKKLLKTEYIYINPNTGISKNIKFQCEANFGDIYLADNDQMIAIRYNPSISNFKWVTQDSITNTLGGVYPVIRRNGDTKYRQFTLSGTLYFDTGKFSSGTSTDSTGVLNMNDFLEDSYDNIFLSQEQASMYSTDERKKITLRKRMKDIAMQFLSNGTPKLYRSKEEGSMLVYLSNVSFSPNKTLSREVCDFTATVTEFCEVSDENFVRYGFKMGGISEYIYILNATGIELNEDGVTFTVYIDSKNILEDGSLLLTAKAVKL